MFVLLGVGDKLQPHAQLLCYAHDLLRPFRQMLLKMRRPPNERPRVATLLFRPLP